MRRCLTDMVDAVERARPMAASDRQAIRRSLAAHSDRLEERRAADGSISMPSATVSDLLLTLHRAVEALA
jgi:hypothetical protein